MVILLSAIIFILVMVILLLYQVFLLLEQAVLFIPSRDYVWTPTNYQEVTFQSQGYSLRAWYFVNGEPCKDPVVLFCHGNTGNISHRQYIVDLCREMHLSLFLFDYRGYGKSKGISTLDSLKQDGEAAYNYLRQQGYRNNQIIVWGESLGGITASHIASKFQCFRLLLMATFADLTSLTQQQNSYLSKLVYPFLWWQAESNIKRIKEVKSPILVIHSNEDELIPYSHALQLYANISHDWKSLLTVKGGHGTPQLTPAIVESVMRFCWLPPRVSPKCQEILDYIAQNHHKHDRLPRLA